MKLNSLPGQWQSYKGILIFISLLLSYFWFLPEAEIKLKTDCSTFVKSRMKSFSYTWVAFPRNFISKINGEWQLRLSILLTKLRQVFRVSKTYFVIVWLNTSLRNMTSQRVWHEPRSEVSVGVFWVGFFFQVRVCVCAHTLIQLVQSW